MVIRAYSIGIFPMASRRSDPTVHWVAPTMRGVLPLTSFHVPRRLRRTVVENRFEVRCDTAFAAVIDACAMPREGHPETWINVEIARVFAELHAQGHAHSVETWQDGRLIGGLYGLALGGAFFGESMFSQQTDASKVALVHLVARLRLGGFVLLDIQFVTQHLRQFGA
ncbi:MAG TPA: leucyl/phenylalanyl-tRNA--protein transferase, partial [Rhodospirillales bacterium]|nr:leucyl/phenylalanyl-tRNA--protein transferase [Rhodospirillales bacterium]